MKVSILIACYNSARWVRQAVESALAQTWPETEVLVHDDGSTDESLDILRSYGGRIALSQGPNRGVSAARDLLLRRATSEWIQYLDGDDYLLPDRIERQVAWLEDRRDGAEVDLVLSPTDYEYFDGDRSLGRTAGTLNLPHDAWVLLCRNQLPQLGGAFWRRRALLDIGGWDLNDEFGLEDVLYLRLLEAGKQVAFCPTGGGSAVYRIWSEGTLWRANLARICGLRARILARAEQHLAETGQLTRARRDAIAVGRLDCARELYGRNRPLALALARTAKRAHPTFRLPSGSSFPKSYRAMYHLVGFSASERLASLSRSFRQLLGS